MKKSQKQKVVFFIVGSIASDPGPYNVIKNIIYYLRNHYIKTSLCLTTEEHISLEQQIVKLKEDIARNEEYIAQHTKYFRYCSTLKLRFISFDNEKKLLKEMQQLNNNSPEQKTLDFFSTEDVIDLASTESHKQKLQLLEMIDQYKIPCIGVDNYWSKKILDSEGQSQRINAIAEAVIQKGIDSLNGANGVITCEIEYINVFRLAHSIAKYITLNDYSNYEIRLTPLFIHSKYVHDRITSNTLKSVMISNINSNNLPTQPEVLDIFVDENQKSGEFFSKEINSIIGNIINFLSDHIEI